MNEEKPLFSLGSDTEGKTTVEINNKDYHLKYEEKIVYPDEPWWYKLATYPVYTWMAVCFIMGAFPYFFISWSLEEFLENYRQKNKKYWIRINEGKWEEYNEAAADKIRAENRWLRRPSGTGYMNEISTTPHPEPPPPPH